MRVDGTRRVPETERRGHAAEHDVRVVKRFDRADVGPVAAVHVRLDLVLVQRVRNQLATEVDPRLALEHLEQDVAREDVNPHRRHERLLVRVASEGGARWDAAADLFQTIRLRLLFERDDIAA